MKAMQVLELSLKFLLDDFLNIMKRLRAACLLPEYKYVIIVPTYFDQNMQDFIRKAAEKVLYITCIFSKSLFILASYKSYFANMQYL